MNKIIVWYYQVYPEAVKMEWNKFRDIEIELIEEAFQKKERFVLLDRCRLDLYEFVQIDLNDETRSSPIKRDRVTPEEYGSREYRFASPIPHTSSSSFGSHESWCPFLKAWFDTPSGKRAVADSRRCLEACAQGIIKEGELNNNYDKTEATYMAGKILQCIGRPVIAATKVCINLYTKNSFLFYVLNKALREEDHSKLETLGPYCYLLRNFTRVSKDYIGTVFRGVQLTEEQIETYKDAISQWKTWPAFTSTSLDQRVAEPFGSTMFVINISQTPFNIPRAFDIAEISHFPGEKEILIVAGTSFQIIDVVCQASGEYIITVKM